MRTATARWPGSSTKDRCRPRPEQAAAGYESSVERSVGGLATLLSRPEDATRIFSFAERADGQREFEAAEKAAIDWFEALPERPDVVVIHQNGIAQALARHLAEASQPRPLLILTGHDHLQHIDRYATDLVVVDGGTVGGGGAPAAGQESVGLAEVHFRGEPLRIRSADLINFDPISGEAEAERGVPGADLSCEREIVICHDRGE